MSQTPLISVILPVYNAGQYLRDSIQSILNQTLTDFELIILNDGSKDNSEAIVKSFTDDRIRYFQHDNCGLAATLNKGIKLSKGVYIARQDQDDISLPDRFEKQIKFLEEHPQTVLLGTRARIFTDDLKTYGYHNHPVNTAILEFDLMFNNPFVHSSVIFRKDVLQKTGLYYTGREFYEDYHLWSDMMRAGEVKNHEEVLVEYRHHESSLSKGGSYFANDALYAQCVLNIETFLGKSNNATKDLPALIHSEFQRYKGTSWKEADNCLTEIAYKLSQKYPEDKGLIEARRKEYKSMLGSAMFAYKLNINKSNKLKRFFIRVENKLRSYF